MNITVVRESLYEILQKGSFFTSSRINDIKILKGVLITAQKKGITIKTTNMEEYFEGELGGRVDKAGSLLIDFKTFLELIKSLAENKIQLEKKEKVLEIKSKTGLIKLPLMDEKDFPESPFKSEGQKFDQKLLDTSLIEAVIFSCATDEARPILTGLCYDFLTNETRVVGTDGFRLAMVILKNSFTFAEGKKIIVSARSLSSIIKAFVKGIEGATYLKNERQLIIKGNGCTVATRLLEGEFPPYTKVIPEESETKVAFKKEEFFQALRSVSLFARSGANMLILEIDKQNISLSSAGAGVGEATLKVPLTESEGKENKITFNYRFLWDYLSVTKSKEIEFSMSNAFSPGVFKGKDDQRGLHIIMPVRSQE